MPGENRNGGDLLGDLKAQLECPVCLNVCTAPPIYQCSSGHMLCSVCYAQISICPICRETLTGQRLLFAEKMLEKLPRTCRFEPRGCGFEDFNVFVVEHEKTCVYAPVDCRFKTFGCDVQLAATAITHHETICDFTTIKCPIPRCNISEVVKAKLNEHIDRYHVKRSYKIVFITLAVLLVSLAFNYHLYYDEGKNFHPVKSPTVWVTFGLTEWCILIYSAINFFLAKIRFPFHATILKYVLAFEVLTMGYNLAVSYSS
eukprot:TRINITY_DN2401_c0_g1_i1.p1 TRINITY_DN2401_c0_g1~~TRINITY_DN2401_c0_g1_i1.p1  ORF type:complete len:258 (+),score=40.96 TRINITY_DN2401_c0_g1_i1:147-920(+)